jgi:hypothetical protein
VEIRWSKFIATGAITATLTLAASVGALLI